MVEPNIGRRENSSTSETGTRGWTIVMEPSKELGGLYLGNHRNAQDSDLFRTRNIVGVLNLAGFECPNSEPAEVKMLDVKDNDSFDLTVFYEECFDFINRHRATGKSVFVHCLAGRSRSPAIVIGYLMKTSDMDFEVALEYVKTRRECVNPNKGFREQLKAYGEMLKLGRQELKESQKLIGELV